MLLLGCGWAVAVLRLPFCCVFAVSVLRLCCDGDCDCVGAVLCPCIQWAPADQYYIGTYVLFVATTIGTLTTAGACAVPVL